VGGGEVHPPDELFLRLDGLELFGTDLDVQGTIYYSAGGLLRGGGDVHPT